MTVYVDDTYRTTVRRFRRMKMSHMIADSAEELPAMVGRMGLQRTCLQKRGTADAVEIAMRELAPGTHRAQACPRTRPVQLTPDRRSWRHAARSHHPCAARGVRRRGPTGGICQREDAWRLDGHLREHDLGLDTRGPPAQAAEDAERSDPMEVVGG
ncbi:DUF4031 domain-containing protein [Salipiger pacificus]|uniref:DUF4031 domain-containing protein n=1 Tax=Salipiger mangrovisoli TaxID=2865933 RepID=A0ABR9WYD7_9RHOB|nr:DUF4031 domain-containing protein [Salipiger mangrovisoli]